MIPVALPRSKAEKPVRRTFQCVTCLGFFPVRFTKSKRSCVECEALRVRAKEVAQARVHAEIKAGRMKPATAYQCVDCGAQAAGYEHRNYSEPLCVDPVCRRCNRLRGPAAL
jgi:hypothetical protein